ncbi:hypothetical protein BH24BAC1_BH24BAC1_24620 [soil metagenome]
MTRLKQLFILISIPLLFSSFDTKGTEAWKKDSVVIAGKVLNFNKHPEHKTIQFSFRDLFTVQKKYVAIIKEDGTFQTKILLYYPQDFYLDFRSLTTLFCSPGDSLYLEVDADIWKDQKQVKPNGRYFVQVKGGSAIKANQNVMRFLDELPDEKYTNMNAQNAVKSKSAEEFTLFIAQREKEYRKFLKKFNKSNKTDQLFRRWADDRLRYESWNDLMRYTWEHAEYNQIRSDSFRLPNSYFSFLQQYDMNDQEMISIAHADFLQEFYMFASRTPKDSLEKAKMAFKGNNIVAAGEIIKNMFNHNSSGFTRQLLYAKFYLDLIEGHQLKEYDLLYDSTLITIPHFSLVLRTEMEKVQDYLANKNTLSANLIDLESDITADLMQLISSKFKNKVIYIDFWGPWCSPCMKEMPYSKKVQQYFKDEEVVFLFLAVKTNENSWKATIANEKLTGEHVMLTNDQVNLLAAKFDIVGYPHYTLIDKKGNVALRSAPNPSSNESLIKEIEQLLK